MEGSSPPVSRARPVAVAALIATVFALGACGGASRAAGSYGMYRNRGYGTEAASTTASTAPAAYGGSAGADSMGDESPMSGAAMPSRPSVATGTATAAPAGAAMDSSRAAHGSQRPATSGGAGTTAAATTGRTSTTNDNAPTSSVSQMLIYTAGLTIMVDQVPAAIDRAIETAVASGGFLAQRTDVSVQVRVPSARFREVLASFERLGDVQHREVQAEDVSEQFHDMEVQLSNLRAVQRRLQEFLARANNITEMLTVERELERIAGQIDQIEGRMRFLQSRAAFSTITLTLAARPVVVAHQNSPVPITPVWLPNPQLSASVDWLRELGLQRLLQLRF